MKKRAFYISTFLLFVCSLYFYYPAKVKRSGSYNAEIEDSISVSQYESLFEEFSWVASSSVDKKKGDLFLSFRFLDALFSGEYLDYLALFINMRERARLKYDEFTGLSKRLKRFLDASTLSEEQFKEALFYSLLVGRLENSEQYKKRAWVYEAGSLSKMLVMHSEAFPTMSRFCCAQKKFVQLVLEGMEFEGCLEKYMHNVAYNIGEGCPLLKENIETFDLSFIMFICRLAGKYSRYGEKSPGITSGYYSYLNVFEKDLITHLQPSY